MMSANTRRWFWGALISLNTGLIFFNGALGLWEWASFNFLSALGCWVGFFIADKNHKKENDNGD